MPCVRINGLVLLRNGGGRTGFPWLLLLLIQAGSGVSSNTSVQRAEGFFSGI